jgi:uncharacterized membrane protein SpoIIM required for sporulation
MTLSPPDDADPSTMRPAPSAPVKGEIVLKSSEFRRAREQSWRELEGIVQIAEKRGVRALTLDDLERMPLLYRSTLSSLSVARAIALDRHLLLYLENLALRAYLLVYGPRIGLIAGVSEFLRSGFPRAVRSAGWHLAISAISLLVGATAGFMLIVSDESWFSAVVPAGLSHMRGAASTRASLLEDEIFAPWGGSAAFLTLLANLLFAHNTWVGIFTFSLGFAAGVPTLLLLAYQGLILGAFLALHYDRGLTTDFLGWVLIHGVTEIGAILLCGAAGLVIAEKILFPDQYSRIDSLALRGRAAGDIALGAILMFLVAAILEGGLRQLIASTPWRFAVALSTLVGWLSYFLLSGRRR